MSEPVLVSTAAQHQQEPAASDNRSHSKLTQKLGLKALTDSPDGPITLDDSLIRSLTTSIHAHTAAADYTAQASSIDSHNHMNSTSSTPKAGPELPWAPDTPPGTPGKLQHSSSVDSSSVDSSSSSSSGPSSPRLAPTTDDLLQDTAEAAVTVPAAIHGLSEDVRKAFSGKRVLIISGGTRGDVQPATALGVALSGLGAHVGMATDASFREFVQQHGLQHMSLGGNAREMMALTVKWGGMLPTDFGGMFWLRGQIREVMESVWAAADAFQPDLILANQLAYGQVHVAEKLGVPLHIILTIPWVPTTSIAHPWARAYGANIVDYINAAAEALLKPGFKVLSWFNPKLAHRLQKRALEWVAGQANYISTPLLDHMAWSGIADLMLAFRKKLGLTQFSSNNLGSALYRYPTTCLFSSHLVPRPADWAPHVNIAGFLSLEDSVQRFGSSSSSSHISSSSSSLSTYSSGSGNSLDCGTAAVSQPAAAAATAAWQPPQELIEFLAAGSAPLYIGFGSMVVQQPQQLMQTVLEAVDQLPSEQRVILCSGWSGIGTDRGQQDGKGSNAAVASTGSSKCRGSSRQVLFIQEAPHDWLFPRCSALLHHGGVGTTAVGLRHAKPTLVISAFGDLFFWGEVCHKLGVGPEAIPLDDLTSQTLGVRLNDLVNNKGYSQAAKQVALQLASEDGLLRAVESVASSLK